MNSTPGALVKWCENGKYYKASTFGYERGFTGHEAINEVIVSYFLKLVNIPHIHYWLGLRDINTEYGTFPAYVSISLDYRNGRDTVSYERYERLRKPVSQPQMDFLREIGAMEYIYQMFFADFCTINRDRHGANIEVFDDGTFVPLYDNGLSFVAPYLDNAEAVAAFDPLMDYKANNYVGDKSLYVNLCSIPKGCLRLTRLDKPNMKDFVYSMPFSDTHKRVVWDILEKRWDYAAEICNPQFT